MRLTEFIRNFDGIPRGPGDNVSMTQAPSLECLRLAGCASRPGKGILARPLRVCGGLLALVAACEATEVDLSRLPAPAARRVDFVTEIRPILAASCFSCHGAEKRRSNFDLTNRGRALQGGDTGVAIVPGDSAKSPLIHYVSRLIPDMEMPPAGKGDPLSGDTIGLLRAWIDQGAVWPEEPDPSGASLEKEHWAFQPPGRPALPEVRDKTWARTPIDRFILAQLESQDLAPSPEADPRTLIRRLYLVMLGMPPTPTEVAEFVLDPEPEAFERLVDRVLADPRYGERWGRHWLDVVRFAESNGFETNRERPNAWRFRDYVIGAFNQDKPFPEFVREQIAGDALGADVATGFLVGGPVDIVKSPDAQLTAQQRADELDDMVATTGTAFMGLTLGCARCHSHKFDPITQREYYSFTALLSGVKHDERPEPLPPDRIQAIARLEARIADLEKKLAPFRESAPSGPDRVAGTLRPPVGPVRNEEDFGAVEAKWVRFTILATTGAEPCLDELEVYAGDRNVALAASGTQPAASGTLPGYEIHKLEHINDGRWGNGRSWISSEPGRGWVQLELPKVERIQRVVWSRDREGMFKDRLATQYRIEVASEPDAWRLVASSADRLPYEAEAQPAGPVYHFEGRPLTEAAAGRQWLAELETVRQQRDSLKKPAMIYAGTFSQPGPTFRLHRGDPMQPREGVPPATLEIFQPLTLSTNVSEQERRLRLADWLAHPGHPLTTRVIVNRIWQYQFGTGLVDTPNDFGRNGARASHPELLDWLASELTARNGSLKALQREILTSATWRQSSAPREEALRVDGHTRWLWRFPPRRLEAEAIRDSILAVSGRLDLTRGGPSFYLHNVDRENVYHYYPKEEFGDAESRRMVYAFKVRMEQDGVFGAFDCPDGSLVMPRRGVSTTPLQALNLFNSRFTLQAADHLADRLEREAGEDVAGQVQRAWQLAFNRLAAPGEAGEAIRFVEAEGLPALCRAMFNANEFLFIP